MPRQQRWGLLVKSDALQTPDCCHLHPSQLENQPLGSAPSYLTYLVGGAQGLLGAWSEGWGPG